MVKKFHALNTRQMLIMENAGFLSMEIREFDKTLTTDFHSTYFQRMLKSRRDWRDAMLLNGWTGLEVKKRLMHWYRIKESRSPWDWFRLEYIQVTQKPTLTKSKFEAWDRMRREVSGSMGRAYGRIRGVKYAQRKGLPGVPKKRSY